MKIYPEIFIESPGNITSKPLCPPEKESAIVKKRRIKRQIILLLQYFVNPHLSDPVGPLITNKMIERVKVIFLHKIFYETLGGVLETTNDFVPQGSGYIIADT